MKGTGTSKETARVKGPRDVDAYVAELPPEARMAVQKLRKTIGEAAPGAVESFSYGVPAFRLEGRPIVCYAAAKKHYSLFPMSSAVINTYARELKAFETSRGTIRFPLDGPLPVTLVKRIVKARVAELRKSKK